MLRSILSAFSARQVATFAILVPFTLSAVACDDSIDAVSNGNGADAASGEGGPTGEGGVLADGGSGNDTTAPTVLSNEPLAAATGEATTSVISVTFSEGMAPATIDAASFTVKQGTVAVAGTVTIVDDTALFSPTAELALGTAYTATISTAATDLAGNALAAAHSWTFTTDAAVRVGPAPVLLGHAGKYVVLAKAAIANVPTSAITGDVGLSPAAASYITGLSLTKAGTKWTTPQVVGSVFAADNDPPTPTNLTTAVANMQTAYTDAAGRPTPTSLNLSGGTIGGVTLAPGLYKWTSAVTIPTDLTLAGAKNDVWIFQVDGNLSIASAKRMILSGGAQAKNIVWQVAGAVNLGTTSHFEGIVLSKTAISLASGASINGRLYAQTAVNLAGNKVTRPTL